MTVQNGKKTTVMIPIELWNWLWIEQARRQESKTKVIVEILTEKMKEEQSNEAQKETA